MKNVLLANPHSIALALRSISFPATFNACSSFKFVQRQSFNTVTCHLYPSSRPRRTFQSHLKANSSVLDNRKKPRGLPRNHVSGLVVEQIFGPSADYQTGNKVLYELHKRRLSGSIVDHGISFKDLNVSEETAAKALQWLREHYPIDEAVVGEAYAERELAKHKAMLSEGFLAKAKRWGLVKGRQEKIQKDAIVDDSFIAEKTRLWREAREKKQQQRNELDAAKMMESEKKAEQYALQLAQQQEMLDQKREEKFKEWDELKKTAELDTNEITDTSRSAFSRLFAPTAVGLSLIALCTLFLNPQEISSPSPLGFGSSSIASREAIITCTAITAVHLALFLAWKRPQLMWYMNRYFMLSSGAPRSFSIIGAVMSHQFLYWHLVSNTSFLFLAGMPLHEEVGRANFLSIYAISGIFGNLVSLYWNVLSRNFIHVSLGASGALFGLVGAYFTIQPEREITIPFYNQTISYNSWIAVGAVTIVLLFEARRKLIVDHIVHRGGFIAGVATGWILQKPKSESSRVQEFRRKFDQQDDK